MAITVVNACRDSYYFQRNTNTRGASDPNYLSMAILYLCRSPKNCAGNDPQALILHERIAIETRLHAVSEAKDDVPRDNRFAIHREVREAYPRHRARHSRHARSADEARLRVLVRRRRCPREPVR